MTYSQYDPATQSRMPWNFGAKIGPKRPFNQKQIWAIRFFLDREKRIRDRALFDLAIDSKLRGCDLVQLKIGDLASGLEIRTRATITQRKTGRPVQFEIASDARASLFAGLNVDVAPSRTMCSQSASITRGISARANMLDWWISGWKGLDSVLRSMEPVRFAVRRLRSFTRPQAT